MFRKIPPHLRRTHKKNRRVSRNRNHSPRLSIESLEARQVMNGAGLCVCPDEFLPPVRGDTIPTGEIGQMERFRDSLLAPGGMAERNGDQANHDAPSGPMPTSPTTTGLPHDAEFEFDAGGKFHVDSFFDVYPEIDDLVVSPPQGPQGEAFVFYTPASNNGKQDNDPNRDLNETEACDPRDDRREERVVRVGEHTFSGAEIDRAKTAPVDFAFPQGSFALCDLYGLQALIAATAGEGDTVPTIGQLTLTAYRNEWLRGVGNAEDPTVPRNIDFIYSFSDELAAEFGWDVDWLRSDNRDDALATLREEVGEGTPVQVVYQNNAAGGPAVGDEDGSAHVAIVQGFITQDGQEYVIVKQPWSNDDRLWPMEDFLGAWNWRSPMLIVNGRL